MQFTFSSQDEKAGEAQRQATNTTKTPLLAASSPTTPWATCLPPLDRSAPLSAPPCLLPVVQLIQAPCLTHTSLLLHDRPRLCAPCCLAAHHHPVAVTPLGGRRRRCCYPFPDGAAQAQASRDYSRALFLRPLAGSASPRPWPPVCSSPSP